jgi:hypothetical protein
MDDPKWLSLAAFTKLQLKLQLLPASRDELKSHEAHREDKFAAQVVLGMKART